MHPSRQLLLLLFLCGTIATSVAETSDRQAPNSAPAKGEVTQSEALPKQLAPMTFLNMGDLKPAEFIRANPCVAGSWEGTSETDTHWVGNIYYPTDNSDPDGPFYGAIGLKVKKHPDLKLNLKTWKGWVLLRKPSADAKLDDEIKGVFTLVGYHPEGNYMNGGILQLHKTLPYKATE